VRKYNFSSRDCENIISVEEIAIERQEMYTDRRRSLQHTSEHNTITLALEI